MEHAVTEAAVSLPQTTRVQVDLQADPTVNYASYQNNVPVVRSLTLSNTTSDPLPAIEILVRCEPDFAEPLRLRYERLNPGETRIDAPDLKFQHRYLAELNEAERGRIVVEVTSEGAEVARTDSPVEVPARGIWQWGWPFYYVSSA